MEQEIQLWMEDYQQERLLDRLRNCRYPSQAEVRQLTKDLLRAVIPRGDPRELSGQIMAAAELLKRQFSEEVCREFLRGLPEIRGILETDLQAALEADPAATGPEEVLLCYPGLWTVAVYRLAHLLYDLDQRIFARMMTEWAHSQTGIDIHPGASIGESFFIDHGTGTVIGQTTVIASRVRLYQGVTLGGLAPAQGQKQAGKKRHPTLEENVTVYANATILGGDTVIGRGCMIGAGAFITHSIPPDTTVVPLYREHQIRHHFGSG